jgi:hypothetical protein
MDKNIINLDLKDVSLDFLIEDKICARFCLT